VSSGEKYVAAAYLVVFLAVLFYVVIIALTLQRLQREIAELAVLARARKQPAPEQIESREATEVG
jgi:CcmD family protein